MSVVVYLDETGDHSLEVIVRDFSIFGLVMVIADKEEYVVLWNVYFHCWNNADRQK